MTATELAPDDNPRWLAALVTAVPVALAALVVLAATVPDTRRHPAATSRPPTPPARTAAPDPSLARAP